MPPESINEPLSELGPAVLVIEPNEEHQALSTMALGRRGFRVTIAGSAREGLRLALSQSFAVIVLDIKIRDMPALNLISVLRTRLPRVPKILVVPAGQEQTAVTALERGATGYLVKTARYNELLPSEVERQIAAADARQSLTERERALGASEERFRTMFTDAPVGIALAEPPGTLLETNPAFQRMFGYEGSELRGRDIRTLSPATPTDNGATYAELVRGERPGHGLEQAYRRKDGTPFWGRVTVTPIHATPSASSTLLVMIEDVTQEKEALQSREADARRFQALIAKTSDGISVVRADGTVAWQSPSAERMFGYAPDEVLGRGALEYVHPEDVARAQASFAELLAAPGKARTAEVRIRRKDGTWRWTEIVGTNLLADSELQGLVFNYRDITERNEALDQIRFQASLLSQVRNAVVAADLDFRIVYWNEYATTLYGWKLTEALGKPVRDFLIAPTERENFDRIPQEPASADPWEGELTMIRKDGSTFPASVGVTRIRDRSDRVIGSVAVISGLTKRIRSQREAEARARQEATVASLGQKALTEPSLAVVMHEALEAVTKTLGVEYTAVFELAPDRSVFALRAKLGWDLMLGTQFPNDPRAGLAGYALVAPGPVVLEDPAAETRFRVPSLDTERGLVGGVGVVIPGHAGPFGVLCAQSTSRRTFEANDIDFCMSIANLIASAIERNRMERTLAESDRLVSMGQLAAYVAHEINTPLTNISLLAANIGRRVKDPVVQRKLEAIGEQRRKATAIVTDLVSVPRQPGLRRTPEDIRVVIAAAVEQVTAYRRTDVPLRLELGDRAVFVSVDAVQVRDVFVNLIRNALQATATGSVTVRVTELPRFVFVAVEDTGAGMPPEALKRIFHPFYAAPGELPDVPVGLSTSRSIVAAHGGKIEALSVVGKGSSFTVVLPRFEEH